MPIEILLRYLHFISIFAIVGSLVAEHILLKKDLTRKEIKRIATIDGVYGMGALTLLAVGLTLWLGSFGKPSEFYTYNYIFHIKITLFATLGILSIYPTIFFIKNQKRDPQDIVPIPRIIFILLRLELLLLFIIPLLAGLMAKGIGYFG
jgi:putative membrane protein